MWMSLQRVLDEVPGWLKDLEAQELYLLARDQEMRGNILEVGCWVGRSTICLALGIKEAGRGEKVYTIDSFEGSDEHLADPNLRELIARGEIERMFRLNIARFEVEDVVHLIKMRSRYALPLCGQWKPIRLAFVDGSHQYEDALYDITQCSHLLDANGVILIHDYFEWGTVNKACREAVVGRLGWGDLKYPGNMLEARKIG
jgi:predicted O-methyltransferase YrrM